jgi:predicted dehydrogenase
MSNTPRFLSRRQVIERALAASAALAAPTIIPARALGNDGATAPSNRITMGCIGVGGMGTGNMMALIHHKAHVLAVCDVDADRRATAVNKVNEAQGNSDCQQYNDFREICARTDIDAMMIATPDHWHALCGIEAVRRGKDVYCEKPLTHTFAEGLALVDEIQKSGRVWQTGSQQRSGFNFRWAVELVSNGHIGKVQRIEVGLPTGHAKSPDPVQDEPVPPSLDYDLWVGPSPLLPYQSKRLHWNWRWNLNYGGGQLLDWINHHNDIAHWAMGYDDTGPVEVSATGEFLPPDGVWNAMINYSVDCLYADGVTTNISNKNPMGTKWIGENGWVFVDRGKFEASNPEWTKKGFERGPKKAYHSDSHHFNFLECVKTRQTTIAPASTSHRSCTPGHLGLVAMQTGRKIKFDPAAQRIIGDDAAQQMLAFNPRGPWKL